MDVNNQVKEIKQSFRQMMDGMVSKSMRDKGVTYKLNWGATIPRLKEMADGLGKNYDLAIALWKENIRECKILATMVMPAEQMLPEVADIWMEQTDTLEIAEQAAFNLYQYLPCAPEKAYTWMASDKEMVQCCGYLTLCHVLRRGELQDRSADEFLDQASSVLSHLNNESGEVVKPTVLDSQVFKALQIFASQSEVNAEKVKKIADYLS